MGGASSWLLVPLGVAADDRVPATWNHRSPISSWPSLRVPARVTIKPMVRIISQSSPIELSMGYAIPALAIINDDLSPFAWQTELSPEFTYALKLPNCFTSAVPKCLLKNRCCTPTSIRLLKIHRHIVVCWRRPSPAHHSTLKS